MASILDTTWTIRMVTDVRDTPFPELTEVRITADAEVIFNGKRHQGVAVSEKKVVVKQSEDGKEEHWEFVLSEEIGSPPLPLPLMYGLSWKRVVAQPDAMGAWGADPQGVP